MESESTILSATYEKDNFEADYSLVSGVSKLLIANKDNSVILSNGNQTENRFRLEVLTSEISSMYVLDDYKKSYRIRVNFLIIILSILLCVLIEGGLTPKADPMFAFDIFFGFIIGVLISSIMPLKMKLLTLSFGENGKSKIQVSIRGTKDEIELIKTIRNASGNL